MTEGRPISEADKPQRLRIMVCIRNLQAGAGGMERTAANLASHLAQQKHTVAVAYRGRPGGKSIYNLVEDIEHCPCDGSPEALVSVAQYLQPDVIIYFYATFDEATHIVALCQTGIPLVLHEGSNPDRVINNNWAIAKGVTPHQAKLERLAMMAGCARLRFTLPQYRESLPPALRIDSVAFPNAFAPADLDDISLRSNVGRRIFLNIGGLKAVKNVMAAVQAFALVADELPDWDFHIFSSGPNTNPVRAKLERFVEQKELGNRVKLFDPTAFIGREYGRSHLHVIASKEEGLPNCVAEASRHGLPSIGFACCAGTNSMIINDHNGLLVECGADEIQGLAEAMRRAATDHAARKRWGAAALRESSVYDPERIFGEWEALIEQAAADRATPAERLRRRFGDDGEWRRLRAVQRASLGATPWPVAQSALKSRTFDEAPPKVSIIVPLFNKEDYIAETLKTIAACTYPASAKEVIVVDDCSTDGSATIADAICSQHGWKLIRQTSNSGPSVARNAGIDAATGEYVHFWDADDLYASDGLHAVLRAMHNDGADIGTGIATRDGHVLAQYTSSAKDISGINYARMPESLSTASACFKIYRRDFLNDYALRFHPGIDMEDSPFNLCAFPLAERIVMTSAILGEYQRLENSESRQFRSSRFASSLKIEKITYEHYNEFGLHALDEIRQQHILSKVLPQFVNRAQRNQEQIDENTEVSELNFEFLRGLQECLPRLSPGLVQMSRPARQVRLAYYAIREGYLVWLPALLAGVLPKQLRTDILAKTPKEREVIRKLMSNLRPVKDGYEE